MENKGLNKWFQRDVRRVAEFEIPSQGITLELQGLDWKTTNNLRKKNVIPTKNGESIRNEEGMPMDMIAMAIKKVNGHPFNLYDKATLDDIGVKTHEAAINKLFTVAEIGELLRTISDLSRDSEAVEKEEVEELKN